ncbi:CoA transferase [Photobacterium sanctipauli]|uniref:CoA transferase n=1 Tax=Photobacterium sanctipauli TaxID=1342794 RepID=A0A2T3NWJ1_9GAMM|nr:CaiB/BaiF CoA-transferase family protein [Photobacterium sanctipauli]PSW20579.1 CoA transferase [Photobacterium sanctipauli]
MSSNNWSFLKDIRIVDMSRLLPGPMTTQLLADLGAEVIKIEEPKEGDTGRVLGKDMFARLNRNKKSLTINLKTEEGKAIFKKLIAEADCVVESFRPGVMDRLGFSYEELNAINPKLIYLSLSGYGQTGPYANRAGHDIDFLALSGYFGVPSQVNDKIARPKIRLSDYAGAMYAALSLSVALASAKQSGVGQYIDVAILDAISAWSAPLLRVAHDVCDSDPDKMPFVMPDNDIFSTKDGEHLAIGLFENKFWNQLVTMIGDDFPALADERFANTRLRNQSKREVHALLSDVFASKTLDEWTAIFEPTDMPWAPVLRDMRFFDDPHIQSRGLMQTMPDRNSENETFQVRYPVKFSAGLDDLRLPPPEKGEHTRELLSSLGLSEFEIDMLRESGTV